MHRNQKSLHRWRAVAAAAAATTLAAGCADSRFASPDTPKKSPSGEYSASAEFGPEQGGVKTWIATIRDRSGALVFRDNYAYSTRHGVGITWLSRRDQLWLLSGDVGTSHVDRNPDGTWTKTDLTPETTETIPDEIAEYLN